MDPLVALLAGALVLFVGALGGIVWTCWSLRSFAEGRRALRVLWIVIVVFVASVLARILQSIVGIDSASITIGLGAIDFGTAIGTWWALREVRRAVEEPGRSSRRKLGSIAIIALIGYFGVSSVLPTAPTDLAGATGSILVIASLLFFGAIMMEVSRLLSSVGQTALAAMPPLSVIVLSFPVIVQNVVVAFHPSLGPLSVLNFTAFVTMGALVSGLLAAASCLSMGGAFGSPERIQEILLARLPDAFGGDTPRNLTTAEELTMRALADGAPRGSAASSVHICPECGKPVIGLDYHNHGLQRGPTAEGVGRHADGYRTLDSSDRESFLEHKAKHLRDSR
ncbi:MAG: hypothetical protein ACYDDF_01130 [Thermoplasmatota archaeon]